MNALVASELQALQRRPFPSPAPSADLPAVFVVPAFNEAANLPRLLKDLDERAGEFPPATRVIVVDDGSSDDTADLAESHRGPLTVDVVRLNPNQGPGAAFRAGFDAALAACPEEALVIT